MALISLHLQPQGKGVQDLINNPEFPLIRKVEKANTHAKCYGANALD